MHETGKGHHELPDKKTYGLTIYSHEHYNDHRGPTTLGITLTTESRTPNPLREDATDLGRFYWICVGRSQYQNPNEDPLKPTMIPSFSGRKHRGEEIAAGLGTGSSRRPYIPHCKGMEVLIAENMAKGRQLAGVAPDGSGIPIGGEDDGPVGAPPPPRTRIHGPSEGQIRRGNAAVPGTGSDDGESHSLRDRLLDFGERYLETLKSDLARYKENLTLEHFQENASAIVGGTRDIWEWARDSVLEGYSKMKSTFDEAKKKAEEEIRRGPRGGRKGD